MRNPRVSLFIVCLFVCFLQCRLVRGEFTLQSTNCTWFNVLLHLKKIRKKLCEFINELRCRLMFITRGAGPLLVIRRSTLAHWHFQRYKKGCAWQCRMIVYIKKNPVIWHNSLLVHCTEITKNSCVIELSARDGACFLHSLARKINLLIFLPAAFYTSDQLHSEASFSGKTIETCPSEDNTDAS